MAARVRPSLTRRGFLQASLTFATRAALLAAGGCAGASSRGCPTRPPRHSRRVLADLHTHPVIDEWNARSYAAARLPQLHGLVRGTFNKTSITWPALHGAGIDLICAAHFNVFDEWLSMPTDPNPEAPKHTIRMIDLLEEELGGQAAAPFARLARSPAEMKALLAVPRSSSEFRTAVIHTLEGGHALGGKLAALDAFAARGVAMMGITHFFNKGIASAGNSYPFFPDSNSSWPVQGLTDFGVDVVRRMEELGMIVDLAHATVTAIEDTLRIATRPPAATHVGSRTLSDHPGSLLDEHVQEIVRRGGIVGVILSPYDLSNYGELADADKGGSMEDVVRTVRYFVKICGGHERIAIGSDFSGYIGAPPDMRCLGEIDLLRTRLIREFDGDEDLVEDVMANNTIRFLLENWGTGVSR